MVESDLADFNHQIFLALTLRRDNLGIHLALQLTPYHYLDHSSLSTTRPTYIT